MVSIDSNGCNYVSHDPHLRVFVPNISLSGYSSAYCDCVSIVSLEWGKVRYFAIITCRIYDLTEKWLPGATISV